MLLLDVHNSIPLMEEEELMVNVITSGRFGCSGQETVVCKIVKGEEKVSSNMQTLVFTLYRDLVSGVLWEAALKSRGAQQSWQVFKDKIFQVHPSNQVHK